MDGRGHIAIGVDVGGSGIKAAGVDTTTGQLISDRIRLLTPTPSSPAALVPLIARLVARVTKAVKDPAAPVGVGFPSVVIDGVTKSAANIDAGWLDFDAEGALSKAVGRSVVVVNDADAAGVAEMRFGAGVGRDGTVFVVTLGTGFGSALFSDGVLVPNLELGHMEIRGRDAERRSAAAARVRRGLSWKAWASDLDEHLNAIQRLFWPKLFILGGGVSKNAERFVPRLTVPVEVVPARLRNEAGIVGAAMFAAERSARRTRAAGERLAAASAVDHSAVAAADASRPEAPVAGTPRRRRTGPSRSARTPATGPSRSAESLDAAQAKPEHGEAE
ncbi:MAG TPA: ROK family protein [Candidatus Limnocylindrales bacterium]